jgi:solute carrier family 25 protein 44
MELTREALHPWCDARVSSLVAGATASLCSASLGVPIDVVTQRVQVTGKPNGRAIGVAQTLWRREGLRGFYRGYWASIAVFAPTSAFWWGSYSYIRHAFQPTPLGEWPVARDCVSGLLAGTCAAWITIPIDTVKTRLQTSNGSKVSFRVVASELFAAEGLRGFFRGVTPRMLSMAPTSTLMVVSYEMVKRWSVRQE